MIQFEKIYFSQVQSEKVKKYLQYLQETNKNNTTTKVGASLQLQNKQTKLSNENVEKSSA